MTIAKNKVNTSNASSKAPAVRRPRYRVDEKGVQIEIKLKTASQLFDARDPAPFLERDIDDDAVEYITSSVEEFPLRTPLKVVIHLSEPAEASIEAAAIPEAIHNYFEYQAELQRKKLTRVMKSGQWFLLIGLFFLVGCLLLAELTLRLPGGATRAIIHEGLVITGWVAMWRPIDLFLFHWWPALEKRRYLQKLSKVEIEVRFSKS
jgi:hypothetical protein